MPTVVKLTYSMLPSTKKLVAFDYDKNSQLPFLSADASRNSLLFTDEPDTDLETDRLLGQQRTDDQGFFDDKVVSKSYLLLLSLMFTVVWLSLVSAVFSCNCIK
jgi:hypothetical protein